MAAKKQIKKVSDHQNLTYEEYYDTLMLAKKIRLENEALSDQNNNAKEKTKILETILATYKMPDISPTLEREILDLIKINIFIPDNEKFIADYKNRFDKNIRLISESYQIPAPFVIKKIAEIGKYEQYIERIIKEGGLKEPELEENKDSKKETSKEKSTQPSKKSSTKVAHDENTVKPKEQAPQKTTENPSMSAIINAELEQHIQSMEGYCVKLLASNQQLAAENNELKSKLKIVNDLVKRLKAENDKLSAKKEPTQTLNATQTEALLRQEIKRLEFKNEELTASLNQAEKRTENYRNRAIIAEARLAQIHDNMLGIERQVDLIDTFPYEESIGIKRK